MTRLAFLYHIYNIEEHVQPILVSCRCPPGHGDIYPSLLGSGFLDRLLSKGVKYLFVSNSDNLGATLDVDLLAYFAKTDKAFVMEVIIKRRSVPD